MAEDGKNCPNRSRIFRSVRAYDPHRLGHFSPIYSFILRRTRRTIEFFRQGLRAVAAFVLGTLWNESAFYQLYAGNEGIKLKSRSQRIFSIDGCSRASRRLKEMSETMERYDTSGGVARHPPVYRGPFNLVVAAVARENEGG